MGKNAEEIKHEDKDQDYIGNNKRSKTQKVIGARNMNNQQIIKKRSHDISNIKHSEKKRQKKYQDKILKIQMKQ